MSWESRDDTLIVYVAGPYTASTLDGLEANTRRAIDAGLDLIQKGHTPYIPHLTHYVDQRAKERGIDLPWDYYMEYDVQWLRHCDAVLCIGQSTGADIEVAWAEDHGMPVYWSVHDIPDDMT